MRPKPLVSLLAAVIMALGLLAGPDRGIAAEGEITLLTGEVWQQLTPDSKLAFVSGVVHVVEFERQVSQEAWNSDAPSFLPHFVKGFRGKTLNDVVIKIDSYYAGSPDRAGEPVMKAIVHAVIIPAL